MIRFLSSMLTRNHWRGRLLLAAVIAMVCLQASLCTAQGLLAGADWFERELGQGVVWRHYAFDNLFGAKQSISYIDVDLANPNVDIEFPHLESTRQKTSSMVPAQFPNAVGALNGTYFDVDATGGHRTYLRVDGTVIPPGGPLFPAWGYEGALALTASGAASMPQKPTGGWVNNTTHPNIMACGPLLIIGGTIPSAHLTSIGSHCTARHPRSAVGLTPANHLILLAADGRTDLAVGMSCEEVAQVMEELGCNEAMNLDGGGSTTLWGDGEPYNGVLNYPSDNGLYDHAGERPCSNAIAVTSTAPTPKTWDARLRSKSFLQSMDNAASQTVSLVYENIGTGTWTSANTKLVLARPENRESAFYHAPSWESTSEPVSMMPAAVAPGETTTFTFVLQAPDVAVTTVYHEHFMLTNTGVGRIGPADSEAWMKIAVQPPVNPNESFLVESRAGGQNSGWYSDSGMADTATNCIATSCTGNIGMRWGSTYRSVAGLKRATVAPDFPGAAFYNLYVAWGAGSSLRTTATYHVIRPGTTFTVTLDQTATSNTWVRLGTAPFHFEKGRSGSVVMTNEDIDVSGSMYAGAVKFEYVPSATPDKSYEAMYLSPAGSPPVVDGVVSSGEWSAAKPAATGYVLHNNPSTPATENGAFRMLYNDTRLFLLFQMNDAYLPGYAAPPTEYGYSDFSSSDKIDFFITPLGVDSQRFYRIVFCPNPTTGACHVWSQASPVKTTNALVGTDWKMRGGAAFGYAGGVLTVEYSIPWTAFDYSDMEATTKPTDGTIWGIQPCISNRLSSSTSESVNWEPDGTPSYVYGEPFGMLQFTEGASSINDWSIY